MHIIFHMQHWSTLEPFWGLSNFSYCEEIFSDFFVLVKSDYKNNNKKFPQKYVSMEKEII